jgi:oxygen-independent coproporphyrinogen-3 oxidase
MMEISAAPVASLYIHVPFCAHKCEYCAFFSEASAGELINRYVAALVREIEMVAADLKPRTIFFGGGTPSLLNLRQWETILRALEKLNLLGADEFTVESNPATVSADKCKLLRDFGVNRVSMGVQSLDEKLLDRLGRIHSRAMVFKSFDILRHAGFDNLNLDLMFAIPTQTMDIWRATLREALAMQSEHLSSYEVIYEDDTPLFQQLQAGEFSLDEDLACAMYDELISSATETGFRQYEIANFARDERSVGTLSDGETSTSPRPSPHLAPPAPPNAEREKRSPRSDKSGTDSKVQGMEQSGIPSLACKHNVNYWRGGSFYGLGPSATGYVRGVRTKNWANTQLYCEQLEKGKRAIESSEELSPLRRAGEIAAFGLRMNAGWPFEDFQRTTQFDLRHEWTAEMRQLEARGWGKIAADRFQLTRQGLRFADAAAEMFLR